MCPKSQKKDKKFYRTFWRVLQNSFIFLRVLSYFMEEFYKLLDKRIEGLNHKFQENFSIKQWLYDDIIFVLRDGRGDLQLKILSDKKLYQKWHSFKPVKLMSVQDWSIQPKHVVVMMLVQKKMPMSSSKNTVRH